MEKRKHIIIGCSAAGLSAMESIRRHKPDDEVLMVTREDSMPYSPTLLPYVLAGKVDTENYGFRDNRYFALKDVKLHLGKEVTEILPDEKKVIFHDGSKETYDSLLIATGANPVSLEISGLDPKHPLVFHTFSDCSILNDLLKDARKVVTLYGGGLVAVELAIGVLQRGNPVNLVVRSRILRKYFNEFVIGHIERLLVDKGCKIYSAAEICKGKTVKECLELELTGGKGIQSDLLVNCVGVKPRIELAERAGLRTRSGILVNRLMETSAPGIFAAGDVAESPSFFDGEPGVSAILPSAIRQGEVAGANMAGQELIYEGWIPMNVLNVFQHMAFSVGLSTPSGNGFDVMEEKDEDTVAMKELVFKGDVLQGAMFYDVALNPGTIRYLIQNRVNVGSFKKDLLSRPGEMGTWLVERDRRAKVQ